jgi:8-oxo-dGTP pyrophosphatase MutT (NUDIX family)
MPKIVMASGPVIIRDNQVLLNQHGEDQFWKFCGGKVEDLELNLIETARKEFKEEMGAEFDVLDLRPYIYHTEVGPKDVVLVHYLAGLVGEIRPGADIRQWGWFDINSLGQMELAPNIIPALVHFGFLKE